MKSSDTSTGMFELKKKGWEGMEWSTWEHTKESSVSKIKRVSAQPTNQKAARFSSLHSVNPLPCIAAVGPSRFLYEETCLQIKKINERFRCHPWNHESIWPVLLKLGFSSINNGNSTDAEGRLAVKTVPAKLSVLFQQDPYSFPCLLLDTASPWAPITQITSILARVAKRLKHTPGSSFFPSVSYRLE